MLLVLKTKYISFIFVLESNNSMRLPTPAIDNQAPEF